MARNFQINGEVMVSVKGNVNSTIASLSQLGMTTESIRVSLSNNYLDIDVDAWGNAPPEIQFMLGTANISMSMVHFDNDVLDECLRLSMGGAPAVGQMPRAGTRMGGGVARFAAGYNFIGLNLSSPVGGDPWRFLHAYLTNNPFEYPLGAERSVVTMNWRAIPYAADPYGGGTGAQGVALFDHVLDT